MYAYQFITNTVRLVIGFSLPHYAEPTAKSFQTVFLFLKAFWNMLRKFERPLSLEDRRFYCQLMLKSRIFSHQFCCYLQFPKTLNTNS